MFIAALVKMLPATKNTMVDVEIGYYSRLFQQVFQPSELRQENGSIVLFVGASSTVDASLVVKEIGLELAQYEEEKTAIVDVHRLQSIGKEELEKWAKFCSAAGARVSCLKNEMEGVGGAIFNPRKKSFRCQDSLEECLGILRKYFNNVLIDCYSVNNNSVWTLMAKLADGVVVVVSAGETSRSEIQRTERVVEMSQGKMLGFILNKRTYPVPDWLYKRI